MATNMATNMQRNSGSQSPPATPDNDDDTISLTSTIDEAYPPDTEYVVEEVHAERLQEGDDGIERLHFLVEWSNFPLDQCTWEPIENLPHELRDQWEKKKAKQDPSVATEFQKSCNAAAEQQLDASRHRHRGRNAKRKRLGLPTTTFYFRGQYYPDSEDELVPMNDLPDGEAEISSGYSESDEAEEDHAIDHKAADALQPSKASSQVQFPKEPRPLNRVFNFDSGRAISKEQTVSKDRGQKVLLPGPSKTSAQSGGSRQLKQTEATRRPQRGREMPSTSGQKDSARKSSGVNPLPDRPGSATIVAKASSSTLVPASTVVKKGFKARKSNQAAVNVFSGGKKPRQRQGVGEAEVDSGHKPKLYDRHQDIRKAQLRSRDRDDQAPDIARIAHSLFVPGFEHEINAQPTLKKQVSGDNNIQDVTLVATLQNPNRNAREIPSTGKAPVDSTANEPPKSALVTAKRSSISSETDRTRKKAKTVRFTGAEDEPSTRESRSIRFPGGDEIFVPHTEEAIFTEGEAQFTSQPMEIDDNEDLMHTAPVQAATPVSAGTKKLSLVSYRTRGLQLQSVDKKIALSTASAQILNVTFDAIPRDAASDAGRQWLRDFMDAECLHFGHTVFAEDLISQLQVQDIILCSGSIASSNSNKSLEVIAERLRIMSSGLFVTHHTFNLLMFPTRCDDFNKLSGFSVEIKSPDDVALKYLIFRSAHPIHQLIRPFSARSEEKDKDVGVGREKVLLFPKLLGMQFSELINRESSRGRKQHFFLAFPERAIDWSRSICSWLSVRDPGCKIYTAFEPGSWSAFVEKGKGEKEFGVVILHEAVVPFVRRFPSLSQLLQTNENIALWCLSESLVLQPLQSPTGLTSVIPTMFSRLFTLGKAILITPSFMVSEPQATLKFLKWFFAIAANHSSNKLVTAFDIGDYLHDLAKEKHDHHLCLTNTRWKRMNELDVTLEKNEAALTDEDIETRHKTCYYFDLWLARQPEKGNSFSELNSVICADMSIDPHDEQSLVNWFGWWSLAHSDEYRKFYVIGSSSTISLTRASRTVKIPRYDQSVVNDPDEAIWSALNKTGNLVDAENGANQDASQDTSSWFRSEILNNNEWNMKQYLASMDSKHGHLKVNHNPVSWVDMAMADHFGDSNMRFATIEQWWNFSFPWLRDYHRMFNTYIGFFYTINQEWNPGNFPNGLKPKRQPWIVIYRPVDPHDKTESYQHGKTELIIWDVRAGDELEAFESIGQSQLTWMQRELIRFIKLHAHEKNPGSFLERVWLGGFQKHQRQCRSQLPIDKTAEYLRLLTEDLKRTAPGAASFLESSGYRLVSLSPTFVPSKAEIGQELGNEDTKEYNPDMRIIFHPARGSSRLLPRGASTCTNDLFESARLTRLRDKNATTMRYTYRPTTEWYQQLVAEGRQSEHIMVDCWERIFQQLRVTGYGSKEGKVPKSAASEPSQGHGVRKDSVGSNHSSLT